MEPTDDADKMIILTKDSDPMIRLKALKEMCPCKVREDVDFLWDRIFEMVSDPDPTVRYQVLHTICDGSPNHLESKVAEALEKFNRDPDKKIKRQAHKVLGSYLRTGAWNIL